MKMYTPTKTYAPKKWELSGLQGISDHTLAMHFGLYEGYVKNVNLLNERLRRLAPDAEARRQEDLRRASSSAACRSNTTACACTSITSTT